MPTVLTGTELGRRLICPGWGRLPRGRDFKLGSEVKLAFVRYLGRCMQAPEIQSQCSIAICPNFLGLPQSHTVCALSMSTKLSPAYCPGLGQATAIDTVT